MFDILNYLPAKRKSTPSGWISFNAVCCHHNGQNPDRRFRGGLKPNEQGWVYHCFNCGYTASFMLGRTLGLRSRKLLSWIGVNEKDIDYLNLESLRHRSIYGLIEDSQRVNQWSADFNEIDLPVGVDLVTEEHVEHWQYLNNRQAPMDFPFMLDKKSTRPSIIIPFTYQNALIGYAQRFLDQRSPKYLSVTQPGYVFGVDLQQEKWKYVIVTEGLFDALSIGGLAVMQNNISDDQSKLIRSLGRSVIVVPDQDRAGLSLVERAVDLGWAVSIPDWEPGIKDVNDAVIRYGKLGTLLTIIEAKETSKIKIELKRRHLAQRVRS
jgi:DNA primase